MADPNPNFDELNEKLEDLLRRQEQFQKEIEELRAAIELERLRGGVASGLRKKPADASTVVASSSPAPRSARPPSREWSSRLFNLDAWRDTRLEKFIGENLANKIGILIVVIGVTIGVKYVIDNQLISPSMRIILGYVAGLILVGLAYRLKSRYHNFSAVLLSGGMAIIYFITYAAHEFYGFIGALPAFGILVAITVYTVFEAIRFNRQVIAHIGLVGAYAVPFLVGKDPGQALVLFSYIAVINIGVLTVAVQRYWKPLYYAAFILSWIIFISWFLESFRVDADFGLGMTFNAIFFVIFYVTFLAYKLKKGKKFQLDDVALLLSNAFIFFVLGYLMLEDFPGGKNFQGAFAAGNALIHLTVSWLINHQKWADKDLFLLVAGLALVFITIAIPIQFDGRPVTLLWAGEATLLFWLGRSRQARLYELLSYPVMLLSLGSLLHDWVVFYERDWLSVELSSLPAPFLNIQIFSGLLVALAFGSMAFLNYQQRGSAWQGLLNFFLPAAFLFLLFFTFWQEIGYFWQIKVAALDARNGGQAGKLQAADFQSLGYVWKINYAIFFFLLLSFANLKWWKEQRLGSINLLLNLFALVIFLTIGLYELNSLWDSYHDKAAAAYYSPGLFQIWFRYLSYFLVIVLLFTNGYLSKNVPALSNLQALVELVFHLTVLWILSNELVKWLQVLGAGESDRLGLSILWGVYAFLLVGLGIREKKAYLRIAAMVLLAVTLGKLFFYDLVDLDSVSKTIIFVSLGSLLLVISFLYNKYRQTIFDEADH